MPNEKRLIEYFDAAYQISKLRMDAFRNVDKASCTAYQKALDILRDAPTVDAVEVVRCAYCDPGSRDYNPCWLCKKGGTAHDVEHCHETNYGDYEPIQSHCHLCGRKL